MKTTNKEFYSQVQTHILESLDYETSSNVKSALENVVSEFDNYYSNYEQKMQPNKAAAFKDFLMGLPSCLSIEYTNHMIFETLKEWFEHVGDTYKERTSDKEVDLYLHLIYREFCKLCTLHNVQF